MASSFMEDNLQSLVNSFKKINMKIFLILAYDVIFYLLFVVSGSYFVKMVEQRALGVNLAQDFLSLDQQAATGVLYSVKGFFFFFLFSFAAFLLLMVLNWSFFKGLIWNAVLNKKPSY